MKNILLILLLFPYSGFSQNLVLNGSFEDTLSCPTGYNQIDRAQFWYTTGATTDYFYSTCSGALFGALGYQMPFQGNAYAGIGMGNTTTNFGREFVEGTLTAPLIAGHCFELSYYVNSAHVNYTTDAIQAYLSDTLITGVFGTGMTAYTPQMINTPANFPDTMNWMRVQNYYVANGGEQYIIIGNFWDISLCTYNMINNLTTNNGAYFYIDSVSLVEIVCTGIDESQESSITVWPNPVTDVININSEINKNLDFIIYNSLLETCFKTKFIKADQFSIENLSSGFYYYQVFDGSEIIKTGKLIK